MDELLTVFKELLISYCTKNNVNILPVEIIIGNIYDKRLELAKTLGEQTSIINNREVIANFNGTIKVYNNKNHIIILNENLFFDKTNKMSVDEVLLKNKFQYIQTFIHEYVHILDIIEFAKHFNVNIEDVEKIPEYKSFYYWTEFHAHAESYKFYKEYLLNMVSISQSEILEHIINVEKPYHEKDIKLNGFDSLYNAIEYLKYYIVWETLYNLHFELPNKLLKYKEFYNLYNANQNFDNYANNINIFNIIIQKLK